MNWVFSLALLVVSASAVNDAESPVKSSMAMQLLKESLQDQAPLLSFMHAEASKAKSGNLRASVAGHDVTQEEVPDAEVSSILEEANTTSAYAISMSMANGAAADAAASGVKDRRPVTDEASEFEHDVTELLFGLGKEGGQMSDGKGGFKATPMAESVSKMKELITKVMVSKVRDAHNSDQRTLDRLTMTVGMCGGIKESALEQASTKEHKYKQTSPIHKKCRGEEANLATEKSNCAKSKKQALQMSRLTCKTFQQIESTVASQVVNSQLVKKAASEQAETYVRRLAASVCGSGDSKGFLEKFLAAQEDCSKRTKFYKDKKKECTDLESKYVLKKQECDSVQSQMDNSACTWAVEVKDLCENYMGCYNSKKSAWMTMTKVVKNNERDRKAEWRGLMRMQCLITSFDDGKVSDTEVETCKRKVHATDDLSIRYMPLQPLESCEVPSTYPATAAYKRAEFAMLPALAKGQADANECTGVEEISTTPASYSPKGCKCERISLLGTFSAGPLVKCTGCIDVSRSLDRNSCPRGTKLFSPRTPADWQVVMDSGGEIRDPHFIVDVTRPADRCKGCSSQGMNSKNNDMDTWQTSDDSDWWITRKQGGLKMGEKSEGLGYSKDCYLNIDKTSNVNKLTFNANFCNYHSKSYYCQPTHVSTRPKRGSPKSCTCSQVALTGRYSAGALIKCENCWVASKSRDKNSCPKGTKIFSPASREDWKVVLDSAGPLASPNWIIDVTRSENGCGGCSKTAMESNNAQQATWRTADGSPWWLRSTQYHEPSGDYTANCYMAISGTPQNENDVRFNDNKCDYSSASYYCQPARGSK